MCCITVDYTYDDDIGFYNDAERNADDEYDEDQAEPWQGERVEPWQFDDDYVDDVEGRPKRGDEEQYRNEVEREALRELLAERAAEEARQALVAYLTAGERAYRAEEPQYLVAPNAEDLAVEEEEYNDLMNGDEEAQRGLYDEEPELTEKRFYPYSYEPYGGRWGALVPGAKRGDRDPYDRLYRLAEVLSRPRSWYSADRRSSAVTSTTTRRNDVTGSDVFTVKRSQLSRLSSTYLLCNLNIFNLPNSQHLHACWSSHYRVELCQNSFWTFIPTHAHDLFTFRYNSHSSAHE